MFERLPRLAGLVGHVDDAVPEVRWRARIIGPQPEDRFDLGESRRAMRFRPRRTGTAASADNDAGRARQRAEHGKQHVEGSLCRGERGGVAAAIDVPKAGGSS